MSATVIALTWRSFICRACGLIYDEAQGDIDSGLAPGTRFEDIPDDWCCPLCGVSKADFEPYEAPASRSRCSAAPAVRSATQRSDPGVVIVGAGRAGWQVAQALRARDAAMPITMVSACSADSYDKPILSVAHARGIALDALVRESATAAAERLAVRLLPMTHAVHIDAGSQQLRTTRGTLRYRRLVLASGAAPRLPAALPPSLVWRVNDLAAYRRLRTALDAPRISNTGTRRHVLIVGAGLVGCELANDLALGGHAVTLLDLQPRPLAAALPPQACERLLQAWQALPLRFVGGVQVARLERSDAGLTRVETACGLSFEADAVIAATGLTTPDRLARSAGLAFDTRAGGIEVDPASLRSSDPAIHALGDCIAIDGRASRYIEPIDRQAQAIAAAICGDADGAPYVHRPVPLRVKTSSLPFTLDGEPHPEGRWEVETDTPSELRMAQRRAGAVTASLEARRPAAGIAAP